MKKTLVISLAASLYFLSLSAFAATEIPQQEANNLKHVRSITVTENAVNQCMHKISRMADKEGADFFVIKNFSSIDNGSQAVVTSELYKKQTVISPVLIIDQRRCVVVPAFAY